MPTKTHAGETRTTPKGEAIAVIATLGVKDHDDEITLPGVVTDGAPVILSGWSHDSVMGRGWPVGTGTLHEERGRLMLHGQYWMDDVEGMRAFQLVRRLGPIAEWSWAFRITREGTLTSEHLKQGVTRIIAKADPIEASVVARGAGIRTQTVETRDAEIARQARWEAERLEEIIRRRTWAARRYADPTIDATLAAIARRVHA